MFDEYKYTALFSLMGIFLIVFFLLKPLFAIHAEEKAYREQVIHREVYSVEAMQGSGGRFMLGSGSVDAKPYYYVYIKNEDGGFILERISATNTVVFMDIDTGTEAPYFVKKYDAEGNQVDELHLPPDSIIQAFTLNG